MFNSLFIGIILSGGLAGYFYYTSSEAELTKLRNLNSVLETAKQQQEETISALQQDFKLQTEALNTISVKNQEIEQEMSNYLDIFRRHSLSKLAQAKPGLIQTRANKATQNVFETIEKDSASLSNISNGVQLDKKTSGSSPGADNNKTSSSGDNPASNAPSP